jgi:uncharacterized protein with PIN domain
MDYYIFEDCEMCDETVYAEMSELPPAEIEEEFHVLYRECECQNCGHSFYAELNLMN